MSNQTYLACSIGMACEQLHEHDCSMAYNLTSVLLDMQSSMVQGACDHFLQDSILVAWAHNLLFRYA